jgi:hypothetical protein
LFFSIANCTRLVAVEGQHRCELCTRAAFGYRVNPFKLPLQDDPERTATYSAASAMYKTVGVTIICDKTTYTADQNRLNLAALKEISAKSQAQADSQVSTPAIMALRQIFAEHHQNMQETLFQQVFLGIDHITLRRETSDPHSVESYIYRQLCRSNGNYPRAIITTVEEMVTQLLIHMAPFKNSIVKNPANPNGDHEDAQNQRLFTALAAAKGSAGTWMWMGTSGNTRIVDVPGKGPTPTCHHSLLDMTCTGQVVFEMYSKPYDPKYFKTNVDGKNANTLVRNCCQSGSYKNTFYSTCLHMMIFDLTQYTVCFPFVNDAFLQMVNSFNQPSVHPINNPEWFCYFILVPCKTIAEIIMYHVVKSRHGMFKEESKLVQHPQIIFIDNDTTLDDLRPAYQPKKKPTTKIAAAKDINELKKLMNQAFKSNTNGRMCDPLCDMVLKKIASESATRGKMVSMAYARALEMYFQLLYKYANDNCLGGEDNRSLVDLRDKIASHQERELESNSKCTGKYIRRNTIWYANYIVYNPLFTQLTKIFWAYT